MLHSGIIETKPAFIRRKGEGKINFGRPPAHKLLISLDLAPEMEENGKIWKDLLALFCAQKRVDCPSVARSGKVLKKDGFDFTESRRG
jgi:hypothetical protein